MTRRRRRLIRDALLAVLIAFILFGHGNWRSFWQSDERH
jgi:hypothetical protein